MTYPPQPQNQPQYLPQQNYPPQNYPPQNYPPQPQYPPQPAAQTSLDAFYDQPAASGKSIASWFQTPGQSITGIIPREITDADTRQQTDMMTKQPSYFSDRRPKVTMTIPLLVQPSPDFPDGRAAWIIGASDREDLDNAMQAAGCKPRSVPEKGAVITVTFTGFKQIPGFGAPKKVKKVTYRRPEGANDQAPAAPQPAVQEQAPPFQAAPAPQYQPQPPASAPQPAPAPQQYAQYITPEPAASPRQPAIEAEPVAELSAEHQALLAKLTGQQQG